MLNFINKILNYFGYTLRTTIDIEGYLHEIDSAANSLQELDSTNFKLFKEKDRLINLVADKDKEIQALEHKVHNFQTIVEEDKSTIENLNKETIELGDKIARLDSDIIDLSSQVESYKQLSNQRYKEVNLLRSRTKGLTDSRDNYKRKYKEVCGKIALSKACPKQ